MYRERKAKDDFFYAFVMFAMRAAVVFHVAADFVANEYEEDNVDVNEAAAPRVMAAEADAHAVPAVRAA